LYPNVPKSRAGETQPTYWTRAFREGPICPRVNLFHKIVDAGLTSRGSTSHNAGGQSPGSYQGRRQHLQNLRRTPEARFQAYGGNDEHAHGSRPDFRNTAASVRSAIPLVARSEVTPFQKQCFASAQRRGTGKASSAAFGSSGIGRNTGLPFFSVSRKTRHLRPSRPMRSRAMRATSPMRKAV